MTFWQNLLAASSLTAGSVWDLITHPKTGTGATVYIEQIQSTVTDTTIVAEVLDDTLQATLSDGLITSTVT
ncbi:MAG: hypothetical protein PHD04_04925, partial [Candidatus Pacebacteria bacterium]|nr:hypothetical protein [Candidatus Paceibacterota bacterium]